MLVSGPRPYTALSALASLAIQRRSWLEGGREGGREGGLKHGGLLEELLALGDIRLVTRCYRL